MLRNKKIDPTKKKSKPLLAAVLQKYGNEPILEAGASFEVVDAKNRPTHVKLTKTLVGYYTNKNNKKRFAICESTLLGKGANSEVYPSKATIKLSDESTDFVVVERTEAKEQAVWRFKPQAEVAAPFEQNKVVDRMAGLLKRASFFHAKNAVPATENNNAALIMRRLPGKPLIEYLKEDAGTFKNGKYIKGGNIFTVDQRIALTIMIADAINEQMHKNGIIHRDIKADNIMVVLDKHNNPLSVYIVDISSAKSADELGVNENVGTPGYQAPEMLFAKGARSDVKSDAFAFATMLANSLWDMVLHSGRYKDLNFQAKLDIDYILKQACNANSEERASILKIQEVFQKIASARAGKLTIVQ